MIDADRGVSDEAPMWCFLPAIWPSGARAWVRDTRIRHMTRDDGPATATPEFGQYADRRLHEIF